MSKRYVRELSLLYENIFRDALVEFPALESEFKKDLARITRLATSRGVRLFLVDLPNLGKHLDRCLSKGQYSLPGLPLSGRASGTQQIPKFLRGLLLLIFDKSGRLKEDYNVAAILFARQLLYCCAKTALDCSDVEKREEIRAFLRTDLTLPLPSRFWGSTNPSAVEWQTVSSGFRSEGYYYSRADEFGVHYGHRSDLFENLEKISRFLTSTLGPYDPSKWKFRHGPGAVSDAIGPTNKCSWVTWTDRLESAFPLADYGYHSYASWAADSHEIQGEEPSSRLVTVPKTITKPRLIACEPREHQWCQQNIWHYFRSRTEKTWISRFIRYDDQTLNQDLCRKGSRDGSLATVDLSAASDRVTCLFVECVFGSNRPLLHALQATRTRYVSQKLYPEFAEKTELRKFSTMGNACTFPVESFGFLVVALAATLSSRGQEATPKNIKSLEGEVAVFGDDLIVPVEARATLCSLLEVLNFKVNLHKSYWEGNFRESCGVDSFNGVSLTPVYWKDLHRHEPASTARTYAVANAFYLKGYWHTAERVALALKGYKPLIAVDSGVLGLKTFVRPTLCDYKSRWNRDLQRWEALMPVIFSRAKKLPIKDDSALLQFFTAESHPFVLRTTGVIQRPQLIQKLRWIPIRDLNLRQV